MNPTPISDAAKEMISTHRCRERWMVPLETARQLEDALNDLREQHRKTTDQLKNAIDDLHKISLIITGIAT